ncbi:MAG: hypothetical protein K2Y05_05340 [Hyphomicrobiaceae bacterium]|nr:hypothetical protein [Hyphomicrobiaceae bacterium]
MLETFDVFWVMLWRTDYIVWVIASVMAIIASFFLHSYSDNTLMSVLGGAAMLLSILVAHTGFALLGVMFLSNKSANAVVAAGIAIMSMTVMWIVIFRILVGIGDATNPLKGDDSAQTG